MEEFTLVVAEIIKMIPAGKVMTYKQIAFCAGSPGSARQVARILHSCSEKYSLPWHRVINSMGKISFTEKRAYSLQKKMLSKEGIVFDKEGKIDLEEFSFKPFRD
ncbi:MGMT family protein [candidate division WOR-3 bacterium]|nr:MGMT family protein [candidate division WOR-3 bacterium]